MTMVVPTVELTVLGKWLVYVYVCRYDVEIVASEYCELRNILRAYVLFIVRYS